MTGDAGRGRQWRPTDPNIQSDPYATLGLPPGAPLADVKRAYRRLAKAFHPDSAGSAALPRFLAIHAAYERITTGRVLPGTAPPRPAPEAREPWRADPARARATRGRAASGGARRTAETPGTGGSAGPEASAGAAGTGGTGGFATAGPRAKRERRGGSGRRHATRKATLGSTSYDDARDRADATWSGASWYGPTTGEYWIINPREYADPRKHGPAYQARIRQRAAEAAAARAEGEANAGTTADGSAWTPPGEASGATVEAEELSADPPEDVGPRGPDLAGSRAREAGTPRARPAAAFRPTVTTPDRPLHTGEANPLAGATADASDGEAAAELPWSRWPLPGRPADDPLRRLRLALVAWPPLGVAAAIAAGDVTGCAVYAATCTGVAPMLPWLAQVVILALLMLLPPLARFLAFGTVAVLLALVPTTAVLIVLGGSGRPQAGFALGILLALAWLAGVAYAAVAAARRASLSSPP